MRMARRDGAPVAAPSNPERMSARMVQLVAVIILLVVFYVYTIVDSIIARRRELEYGWDGGFHLAGYLLNSFPVRIHRILPHNQSRYPFVNRMRHTVAPTTNPSADTLINGATPPITEHHDELPHAADGRGSREQLRHPQYPQVFGIVAG